MGEESCRGGGGSRSGGEGVCGLADVAVIAEGVYFATRSCSPRMCF